MKITPCSLFKSLRVLLMVLFCVPSTWADHWPQFRGPQGNQIALDRQLPQVWSPDQNIKWQVKIPGRAWSSPVVWGDKIFITNAVDEVLESSGSSSRAVKSGSRIKPTNDHRWEVYCLDTDSGKILWRQVATQGKPTMITHSDNTYASETPVTDGKRVYVYFGMNGLYCYDFTGKLLWEKDLGAYQMERDWGTGSSPIIHGDLVYLQIDNEEQSFLVALDGKTGEERWRVSRQEGSNWCTPVIWQNRQRTELVTGGKTVRGYDPVSGKLWWELNVGGGRSSASPTADRECLYFGIEKRGDNGGFLFAVKAGANGNITPKPGETTSPGVLWAQSQAGIAFASPLVYQDFVYILGRTGGRINCYHARTGESVYSERLPGVRTFWATPWAYKDKIFCLDDRGTTHVLQAGREFIILGQNKLNDNFYASCALTENSIILRGAESLYCIGETLIKTAESETDRLILPLQDRL
jgi:outer membrane protein assembly factor BamB